MIYMTFSKLNFEFQINIWIPKLQIFIYSKISIKNIFNKKNFKLKFDFKKNIIFHKYFFL